MGLRDLGDLGDLEEKMGKDGRTNPSHMKAKSGEIKLALDQNQTTCSQPWWATASIPLMRLGTCVENGRVLSDH